MSKILRIGLLCALAAFVSSPSAHAQVMGVCGPGWMPSPTACTPATSTLDIGTTGNLNPTFNIAINNNGSTDGTTLVILVPLSSTNPISAPLSFSVNFTQSNGQTGGTLTANLASSTPFTQASGSLIGGYLGLPTSSPKVDNYKFNNINAVQTVPGTMGYAVYTVNLPGVSAGTNGNYLTVSFTSNGGSTGFPYGTIFLAYGTDPGTVDWFTPLTDGLETVPEPATLGLFGSGLLGIAMMVRRRMRKPS